jgi:rRNA maturation endonuclease Nob1
MTNIELLKEAAEFLHELFNAEILLPAEQEAETDPELQFDDGVPFDVSADKAQQIAADLDAEVARITQGIERFHSVVKCDGCGEPFSYCDAGNHYCPCCGESGEGAQVIG